MKIFNYALCDDIRLEKDNKISLMGLYDDSIVFNVDSANKGKWPKPFSFAILLGLKLEDSDLASGLLSIGVTLKINDESHPITKFQTSDGKMESKRKIRIMPKIGNFPIKSECECWVEVSLFDKDDKILSTEVTRKTKFIEKVTDTLSPITIQ